MPSFHLTREVIDSYPIEQLSAWTDPTFARSLPIEEGMRILDAGCFKGDDLARLEADFPSLDLYGIDREEKCVDYCTTRFAGRAITIVLADAVNLPYPNDYFDIVYGNGLLEDDPLRKEAIEEELRRVGKKVYFSDVNTETGEFTRYGD